MSSKDKKSVTKGPFLHFMKFVSINPTTYQIAYSFKSASNNHTYTQIYLTVNKHLKKVTQGQFAYLVKCVYIKYIYISNI